MFLLDLTHLDVTGKDAEAYLGKASITVNKNSIPNDPRSPFVTSGLRIGSPAITTRGFKEAEAIQVVDWIVELLADMENKEVFEKVSQEVAELCSKYPVYL